MDDLFDSLTKKEGKQKQEESKPQEPIKTDEATPVVLSSTPPEATVPPEAIQEQPTQTIKVEGQTAVLTDKTEGPPSGGDIETDFFAEEKTQEPTTASPAQKVEEATEEAILSSPPSGEPLLEPTTIPIKEEYDDSDAKPSNIRCHMYYGAKGDGKTTLAFSHPGKIYCLSFDQRSVDIKGTLFKNDERIKVKDAIRYLSKMSGDKWLETADKSLKYINHLLATEAKEFEPDWIVIDGLEILVRDVCEKTMRFRNNIMVFQPFNLILWQERNMYVDQIHLMCNRIAKKGVIYTAYINTRSLKIEGGKVTETTREPKWAADVKKQVDTVIRVENRETVEGLEFIAMVESSKTPEIRSGLKTSVLWDKETQTGGIQNLYDASKEPSVGGEQTQ